MKELGGETFKRTAEVLGTSVALANVKKLNAMIRDIKLAHHRHNAQLDPRERVYTQRKRVIITSKKK
jgi:hypothetical protein